MARDPLKTGPRPTLRITGLDHQTGPDQQTGLDHQTCRGVGGPHQGHQTLSAVRLMKTVEQHDDNTDTRRFNISLEDEVKLRG